MNSRSQSVGVTQWNRLRRAASKAFGMQDSAPHLLVIVLFAWNAGGSEGLVNGGFEDARPTWGWEVTTYGAQPSFTLDAAKSNQGQTALCISAQEPSDTAL